MSDSLKYLGSMTHETFSDTKALLRELSRMNPYRVANVHGKEESYCVFCAHNEKIAHADTCVFIRANKLLAFWIPFV